MKFSVLNDMDFITLIQSPNFPFTEWIKIALKSYVENQTIATIPLPVFPENIVFEKKTVNFTLDPVKDKAVIEWLQSLRKGQRTSAIKCVFRCSLAAPCLIGQKNNGFAVSTSSRTSKSPRPPQQKQPNPPQEGVHEKETQEKESSISEDFDIFSFSLEEE